MPHDLPRIFVGRTFQALISQSIQALLQPAGPCRRGRRLQRAPAWPRGSARAGPARCSPIRPSRGNRRRKLKTISKSHRLRAQSEPPDERCRTAFRPLREASFKGLCEMVSWRKWRFAGSEMILAYFDESGDSGLVNSPTTFFVLSGILIPQDSWLSSLNRLVALRRNLRDRFGINTRREIKASDIKRGRGVFTTLNWPIAQRMDFYRNLMRWQNQNMTDSSCFSIAIHKSGCDARGREPRATAWTYALQRLDTFCKDRSDKVIVFPDEGHGPLVKHLIRRMRRFHQIPSFFGTRSVTAPTERIIEDPNDRQSHDSYFIQVADWNAYATHRSGYVDRARNVPSDLWDEIANIQLRAVNSLTGGPPAIVLWPR